VGTERPVGAVQALKVASGERVPPPLKLKAWTWKPYVSPSFKFIALYANKLGFYSPSYNKVVTPVSFVLKYTLYPVTSSTSAVTLHSTEMEVVEERAWCLVGGEGAEGSGATERMSSSE
jgi:hypothetical protein